MYCGRGAEQCAVEADDLKNNRQMGSFDGSAAAIEAGVVYTANNGDWTLFPCRGSRASRRWVIAQFTLQ